MAAGIAFIPIFLGWLVMVGILNKVVKRRPDLDRSPGFSCSALAVIFIGWPIVWLFVLIPAIAGER